MILHTSVSLLRQQRMSKLNNLYFQIQKKQMYVRFSIQHITWTVQKQVTTNWEGRPLLLLLLQYKHAALRNKSKDLLTLSQNVTEWRKTIISLRLALGF
jgi:hypothetical protein